jgi:putative transposase
MTDTAKVPRKRGGEPGRRPLIGDELAAGCWTGAQAEGAELPGPDGLLSQVARAVLERALAEEMTGHLVMKSTTRPGGSGNSATALPARPFGWVSPLTVDTSP